MHIPIALPDGWTAEESANGGMVISTADGQGAVTVNEKMHGFSLGTAPVRKRGTFDGRKWKVARFCNRFANAQRSYLTRINASNSEIRASSR